MSVTSIQFIGLFVVMMNTGAGLHILVPHFPGTPYADHTSVVQYDPKQVASTTWPGVVTCGPEGSLRCAPINLETITFSGAIDPAPVDIVGAISHLRCCCASMIDLLPKYKDPSATGKLSAHIFVGLGVAEAIAAENGRVDTWVTMHSVKTTGITMTANAGSSSSFNIAFKPGAQFTILNTTSDTLLTSHFLAYYLMGIGSSSCTALPTDGPPCAPRTTECVMPKRTITATAAGSVKKVLPKVTDENCANTHFP